MENGSGLGPLRPPVAPPGARAPFPATPAPPGWRGSFAVHAAALFALALLLRVQFLHEMAPHPLLDINLVPGTDMEGYVRWAQRIAAGNWLGWGEGPFWQGPAYPYLLGLLLALAGPDLFHAYILQALLGGWTVVLVYAAGRLLFSPATGLTAGLLAAAYGMLVCFGAVLHSTTLEVFLAAAALYLLALAGARGGIWWLWAGGGLGLTALARPNFLLVIPAVLAGVWLAGRGGARGGFRRAALLWLVGCALVILPVTARNLVVGGELVVVSAAGPETFRIANSYDSTPLNFRYPALPRMPLDSWEFWRHQARKAAYFWWGFEAPQNVNYYLFRSHSRVLDIGAPVAFWMVVPLAALGLWGSRGEWRRLLPIWFFGLAYTLSVVAFHIVGRFRLPLLPLLLVFAAQGGVIGWGLARRRDWGGLGRGVVAAGLLAVACRPWGFPLIYPVDRGNYGYLLANRGELAAGLAELAAAEGGLPGHPNLNYDMGRILLILGRPREALARFERELAIAPDHAEAARRAGLAAKRLGEGARARGHLERYLVLRPEGPQAEQVRRELAGS